MKMNRVLTAVTSLTCFCLSVLVCGAEEKKPSASDLLAAKITYDTQLEKINKTFDTSSQGSVDQYIKSLKALEAAFQEKGKLEPLLSVKKERERFEKDKTVDESFFSQDVPELKALQTGYVKATSARPIKKAKDIVVLSEQYAKGLTALQESLTKAGDLDAAIEVKDEVDAISERQEVMSARFVLEEELAKNPVLPAVEPTVAKSDKQQQAKKQPKVTSNKKYTGKPANQIKKRFNDFCDALVKQDLKQAMEFVDPVAVKEKGEEQVRLRLRLIIPFIRATEQPGVKLRCGDVTVDEAEETASVIPSVWVNNKWHDSDVTSWVQVDGEWYIAVDEARPKAEKRQNLKRGMDGF